MPLIWINEQFWPRTIPLKTKARLEAEIIVPRHKMERALPARTFETKADSVKRIFCHSSAGVLLKLKSQRGNYFA